MLGLTIIGVLFAVVGTFLMIPELFWGYAGIFADVAEQVKEEVWIKHLRFFSDKKKAKEMEPIYKKRAYRWRKMKTAGFILLIIGIIIQIISLIFA